MGNLAMDNLQRNLLWASLFATNGGGKRVLKNRAIQARYNGSWIRRVCFPSSVMVLHCPSRQLIRLIQVIQIVF